MVLRLKDFLSSRRSEAFSILKKQLKSVDRDAKPIRQQDILRVALAQLGLSRVEQVVTESDREQLAIALSNLGARPNQVTRALQSAVRRTRLKGDVESRQSIIAIARSLKDFEIIGRQAKGATQLFPSTDVASSRSLLAPDVSRRLSTRKQQLQGLFDTKRAEVAGRTAGIIEGTIAQSEKELRRASKAAARGIGRGALVAGRGVVLGSKAAARGVGRGSIRGSTLARQAAAATKPQLVLAGRKSLVASRKAVRFTKKEVIPAARDVAKDVATTIAVSTAVAADRAVSKAREIGSKIKARDKIASARFQAFESAREDKATKISNILFEVGIGPEDWNPLKSDERRKLLQESVSPEEFPSIAKLIDFSFKIPFSPLRRVEELKGTLGPLPSILPKIEEASAGGPSRLAVGEKPSSTLIKEAKEKAQEFGLSEEASRLLVKPDITLRKEAEEMARKQEEANG